MIQILMIIENSWGKNRYCYKYIEKQDLTHNREASTLGCRNTKLFKSNVHDILRHKSAARDPAIFSSPLFPLISILSVTHFAAVSPSLLILPHSTKLSLAFSSSISVLPSYPATFLSIAVALIKVCTSLNQSDGRWRGVSKRYTEQETKTDRARGR